MLWFKGGRGGRVTPLTVVLLVVAITRATVCGENNVSTKLCAVDTVTSPTLLLGGLGEESSGVWNPLAWERPLLSPGVCEGDLYPALSAMPQLLLS